jgi:hypothetical protein
MPAIVVKGSAFAKVLDVPVVGQFECGHSRAINTDSVTKQKARKVITAFAAWEYSHCGRRDSHFRRPIRFRCRNFKVTR